MCQRSGMVAFRRQIVDLAIEWVGRETELQFSSTLSDIGEQTTTYRGGRGDNGDVPVLFAVTEEMLNGVSAQTAGSKDNKCDVNALSSTSSLLNHVQKETKESGLEDLRIPSAAQSVSKSAAKDARVSIDNIIEPNSANLPVTKIKLVQELDSSGKIVEKSTSKLSENSDDPSNKKVDKGLFGKVQPVDLFSLSIRYFLCF